MNSVRAALCSIIRHRGSPAAVAELRLPTEAWLRLIAEAERHGLAPLLWSALARLDENRLPPGLAGRARAARGEMEGRTARLQRGLAEAAEALTGSGIRTLVLKGTALGRRCYGDPAVRVGQDIDLLVHQRDVEPAAAALVARGFIREPRPYALIREDHLVRHRDGLVVDLHWNITGAQFPLDLDFAAIWESRQPGPVMDMPGDAWLLLMSAVYLLKDYPELRLAYLADFTALSAHAAEEDWRDLARLAESTGTRRIVALTLEMARRLLDLRLEEAAALFPPDRKVQGAAQRLETALDRPVDSLQPHLARLVQVLRQANLRERRRERLQALASLWSLLVSPTPEDTALAGRLGTAPRLLRPLRLAGTFLATSLSRGKDAMTRKVAGARHELGAAATARGLRRLRPARGVSLHLIDDQGLLFDARGEALYSLSTSAAWLWCSLEEGTSAADLREAYTASFGRSPEDAARDVDATLRSWQELGLLDGFGRCPAGARDKEEADSEEALPAAPAGLAPPAIERRFRLLDTVFRLGLPGAAEAALVEPVMAAFAIAADAASGNASEEVVLQLASVPDGYVLVGEGRILDRCDSPAGVAPIVKAELLVAAINRYDFSFYLHAAMLRAGEDCLLLPAAPGSGKTTLSAALARAGLAYHSDEVTLLDGERLAARGVPLCPAVKEGSWPVLKERYPELDRQPRHRRGDDKIVRYLPPPVHPGDRALDRHWPVRWIVFPRYRAGAATALRPLARIEALRRLLDECLALRLQLDEAAVERLARWIEGIECHELEVGDLDAAVGLVRGLCLERARASVS
ncbi:PqqD family peptide modification chaperone [Geminicoccaceae bacterium 1502E]|nr:PqqD family peptide modification chaperone [Geminicoccaceae bacterium 1502E]